MRPGSLRVPDGFVTSRTRAPFDRLPNAPPLPLFARIDADTPLADAARASIGGCVPKGPLRLEMARFMNRMDTRADAWTGTGASELVQPPVLASTISRDEDAARAGRLEIRQVWSAPDESATPLRRFGIRFTGIQPGVEYDFSVEARNDGATPVQVAAWLIHAPPGETPQAALLRPSLFMVPPGKAFKPFFSTFRLTALPEDTYLLVTPYAPKDAQPGLAVVWKSWRCAPVPRL